MKKIELMQAQGRILTGDTQNNIATPHRQAMRPIRAHACKDEVEHPSDRR